MFIDVHCHLNDKKLLDNIEEVIAQAKQNNIKKMICVGCDIQSSTLAVELAEKYAEVFACVGIHPEYANKFEDKDLDIISQLAQHKKVVAIGEIGLDYHYEPHDKNLQKQIFVKQLMLANSLNLPVQIHCRDATFDTLEILKTNKNLLQNGGIMHCFSGSLETLRELKKLNIKISLGGILTFKNARTTVEIASKMPLDMLTFETDCPYLAPVPFRSQINQPKNLIFTAQKFADIRNINLENLENIVLTNTLDVFPKLK